MAENLLASPTSGTASDGRQVVVHVDAATLQASDDPGGRCELDHGPALHPETVRRLSCDASLVRIVESDGRPLSVGRRTRTIPPALRRALLSRDGGCRFPGCGRHRRVDAHHVRHWARGGRTDIDNLVILCRRHHRLVHEGGYGVEASSGGRLAFRRPDGRLIPAVPVRPRGNLHEPARRNRRNGLAIDSDTAVPHWLGDPLHLHYAVDALTEADPRLHPERAPPQPRQ